eukprot:11613470-Alexandrium_andersonii.AAC.1
MPPGSRLVGISGNPRVPYGMGTISSVLSSRNRSTPSHCSAMLLASHEGTPQAIQRPASARGETRSKALS